MTRWGSFPLGIGTKIKFNIHDPIPVKDMPFPILFEKTEQIITRSINRGKGESTNKMRIPDSMGGE